MNHKNQEKEDKENKTNLKLANIWIQDGVDIDKLSNSECMKLLSSTNNNVQCTTSKATDFGETVCQSINHPSKRRPNISSSIDLNGTAVMNLINLEEDTDLTKLYEQSTRVSTAAGWVDYSCLMNDQNTDSLKPESSEKMVGSKRSSNPPSNSMHTIPSSMNLNDPAEINLIDLEEDTDLTKLYEQSTRVSTVAGWVDYSCLLNDQNTVCIGIDSSEKDTFPEFAIRDFIMSSEEKNDYTRSDVLKNKQMDLLKDVTTATDYQQSKLMEEKLCTLNEKIYKLKKIVEDLMLAKNKDAELSYKTSMINETELVPRSHGIVPEAEATTMPLKRECHQGDVSKTVTSNEPRQADDWGETIASFADCSLEEQSCVCDVKHTVGTKNEARKQRRLQNGGNLLSPNQKKKKNLKRKEQRKKKKKELEENANLG